ncbi:MAG: hypothetical protein IKX48_01625 [Victivallales bacterium]|nr:hypothetical protein [Victivallales bacterium]
MHNSLPGKAFAIGILLLALQLPAATVYTEVIQSGRIRVKTTTEGRSRAVGVFVSRCSERIDKLLGFSGQPQKTLSVVETVSGDEEEEEEKASYTRVRFRPDMNNVEVVHSIVYALIMRREQELPKEAGEEEPQSSSWNRKRETPTTNWLSAGIAHRILVEEMGGVGLMSKDYEIARNQYSLREFPSIDMLVGGGIDADFRPLFELFMLHSDLLLLSLETLRRGQSDLFVTMLRAERAGRDPLTFFDELLGKYYPEGKGRQEFYEHRVSVISLQRHRGGGAEMIAERVAELETVPLVGGSGPDALKRVRLEEIPKILEDYKADTRAFLRLEQRFKDLQMDAPYLLQDSLGLYIDALQLLREGKMRRFEKEFKKAREAFLKALTKQRTLDSMLEEYERKMTSVNARLDDFMEIIQRYHRIADSLYTQGDVFPK